MGEIAARRLAVTLQAEAEPVDFRSRAQADRRGASKVGEGEEHVVITKPELSEGGDASPPHLLNRLSLRFFTLMQIETWTPGSDLMRERHARGAMKV
jgi:hypothetical protein